MSTILRLFAALIVYGRSRGGMARMMTRQVWQWALLLFMFGFMMSSVNNWAHLGGFASGYLFGQRIQPEHLVCIRYIPAGWYYFIISLYYNIRSCIE